MYICINTHVCTHTHALTQAHTRTDSPRHTCINTYTHTRTHSGTHTHTLTQAYMYKYTHTHTCTHSGTHMHTLTQAYMYKYTHTHICMNTHLQYTKPSHSDKPESNPVSNNLPMGWPESRCLRVVPSQHQSADWEWRVRWARSDHMSTAPGRSTGWCRWPAWRLQRTLSNQNTCLGHQK